MLRNALTIDALYVCGCILFELGERRTYEVHSASEGSLREQRLTSMMERKPLQPMAENPVAAHFVHLPLLFFPAIGCLAVMAPPWVIPFLIDGRSIGEMIQALQNVR